MTRGWGPHRDGTHVCPGCRDRQVPNRLFCCGGCWDRLSTETQREIYRTARTGLLRERSLAVQAARKEWNDAKPTLPRV